MNVTLTKILPKFSLILKDDNKVQTLDATGLILNLKRISINDENGSIEIPLENTVIDLPNNLIVIKSKYVESFSLTLTDFEVDQINVLLKNYINLIEEKVTLKSLHSDE